MIYEELQKELSEYSTKIKYSLLKTKKEIYEDMKIKNNISISLSTFYKLIPNNIIKSKKQTDMCNICNLKKIIRNEEKGFEYKEVAIA